MSWDGNGDGDGQTTIIYDAVCIEAMIPIIVDVLNTLVVELCDWEAVKVAVVLLPSAVLRKH